jgi:3-methyl-2-oxobutanoate hydroxymethyltransferase
MNNNKKPITMLTCYDALTAKIAEKAGVDYLLVGDSGGTNVLGYKEMSEVRFEDMCFMTKSVKRAETKCKIVTDIPYEIVYEKPGELLSAAKILTDCGADILKLEIEDDRIEMLKKLTAAGFSVCTHIGYTPQTPNLKIGAQGKDLERARELVKFAKQSQEFGAKMIVLELIPANLAKYITEILDIPTIGIGAGINCSGQVQVWCDISGFSPRIFRHAKLFANAGETLFDAFSAYTNEVHNGNFPTLTNAAVMDEKILEELIVNG